MARAHNFCGFALLPLLYPHHDSQVLALPGEGWLAKFVGEPKLDEGLPGHAEASRFPIQRIDHPDREIDVHSPRFGANAPHLAEIKLADNSLPCIEFAVKCLRFHRARFHRTRLHRFLPSIKTVYKLYQNGIHLHRFWHLNSHHGEDAGEFAVDDGDG